MTARSPSPRADRPAERPSGHAPPGLVLASASPRRADVLARLGLAFDVAPQAVDERLRPGEGPADAAERLARAKAWAGARDGALVLGCDTLVGLGEEVLGKPGAPAEARAMLDRLSGRRHTVYSGMALAAEGRVESAVEVTRVRFRDLEAWEIDAYVATGEPLDKAGAYGIQARGAALVEGIEGDYFAVMGFPVQRLLELLRRFGWRYAYGELRPAP